MQDKAVWIFLESVCTVCVQKTIRASITAAFQNLFPSDNTVSLSGIALENEIRIPAL